MTKKGLTYTQAGVDISEGNRFVNLIKPMVGKTFRPEVMTGIGGFGAMFELPFTRYREPVLVSSTDGVGTKLKIAFMSDKHDTVGIDLVAMCVNDILVQGAEPLFFLDYFATGALKPEKAAEVVKGIAAGCIEAGCALIGGETAEMPGFYGEGEYDLSGFAVGIVEKAEIVDGSSIESGDVVIGLESSGLHSNGYSLARKVLFDMMGLDVSDPMGPNGRSIGDILLTPTKIYVKAVAKLLQRFDVRGMAHITGGGLLENIPRILPKGLNARIVKNSWKPPHIFGFIQNNGSVDEEEMYRVFNNGIGFIIIAPKNEAGGIIESLEEDGETAWIIGEVTAAEDNGGRVLLV